MPDLNPYDHTGAARSDDLHVRTVGVAGMERSYWSATRQPRGSDVPILIAVHGGGTAGHQMAKLTGLAQRGAAAGFHVVFPDALERFWDDHGTGRRDDGDDALFMRVLVEHLRRRGEISDAAVFIVGVENGATFTERVARNGALRLSGIALVGGTARAASRALISVPREPTDVLIVFGEKDRTVPRGGREGKGQRISMRGRRALIDVRGHQPVALETITADWESVNAETARPVVVRSIDGAGDGWPAIKGARRSRSEADPGDVTAMVLDFATAALNRSTAADSQSLES